MAAHRYWRIFITSGNGSSLSLGEIEMASSDNGTDLCTGGTAAASTEAAGSVAANAFDDDPVTWWHASTTTNEWISYDLGFGNDADIITVRITCRSTLPEQAPNTFTIQYSDNDADWFDSWTETNITPWYDAVPHRFFLSSSGVDPISWRIRAVTVDGGVGFGAQEIEFHTSIGGSDICNGGVAFAKNEFSTPTFAAANAFDNTSDEWASSNDVTSWIAYYLTTTADVVESVIKARASSPDQSPSEFYIESSINGFDWTEIAHISGETGWSASEERTFLNVSTTTTTTTTTTSTSSSTTVTGSTTSSSTFSSTTTNTQSLTTTTLPPQLVHSTYIVI